MSKDKKNSPKEKTVPMVVLRDYWPEENNRVRAGTVVDFPVEEALDGLEHGFLARHKD